jgi:hypothetical protein
MTLSPSSHSIWCRHSRGPTPRGRNKTRPGVPPLAPGRATSVLVSEVLRTNELQVWFVSEHLVDTPLVTA